MRRRLSRAARLCALCASLTAVLLAPAAAAFAAQHEGHGQHEQHRPARTTRSRPRARGNQTRRAAPTRTRRRAPSRPASTTTARPAATTARPTSRRRAAPPAAPTRDAHEGHAQPNATPAPSSVPPPSPSTRTLSPAPSSSPARDPQHQHEPQTQQQQHQHQHEPPRPAQPTPAQPTPRPTPTAVDHGGHQMPPTPVPPPTPVQPSTSVPAQTSPPPRAQPTPAGPVLRLEELELKALASSPSLARAEAAVRAAEGRRRQAGMMPNPVVGYSAENVSVRRPSETTEHLFFVEQTFPLGGKLGKSRRVFASERDAAEADALAERQRVLNSVRARYFEALGAERLVELRAELARLAREAVQITEELYNVGQADRPDLLEIGIEAERADIERMRAENEREEVWRLLAVAVGDPALPRARLAGDLEDASSLPAEAELLAEIMRDSPEVRAARARVEQARAAVERARAERAPDLFVRGGAGYNQERAEAFGGGRTGAVVAVETGVRLPLWNRNEGGIAAAEAELNMAESELERLGLALRARLASELRAQRNARQIAEKYRARVIPAARAAYEMYLSNFRQMAASYPQVLIAQRTLFQVQVEYARSLVELRRSLVSLRGFLLAGGETTEGFRLRGANDAAGDSDDR